MQALRGRLRKRLQALFRRQHLDRLRRDPTNKPITSSDKKISVTQLLASVRALSVKRFRFGNFMLQKHNIFRGSGGRFSLIGSGTRPSRRRLASLRENVMTVPNLLCVSRIAMTPVVGYCVLHGEHRLAAAIFAAAGLTDLVDGYIARRFPSQRSAAGTFLDPLADKFLVSSTFIALTLTDQIPFPLVALIVARDLALASGAAYIRYRSLPAPVTLSRYFDPTEASASLHPTFISKVNTGVQLILLLATLSAPIFDFAGHPVLTALFYLTASTTTLSAFSYAFNRNTYKILRKSQPPTSSSVRRRQS